jgi:CheY-like chemotaxis protein
MSSEEATPPGPQQSDSALETTKSARRILVVDDNEDGARMLATLLELEGYDVLTSLSGSEAVETVASKTLDVVLLDIGLPGMDGYEVARRIHTTLGDRAPRLVAITGYSREEDRERARSAGFAAHLVKPVDFQALRRVIADLE